MNRTIKIMGYGVIMWLIPFIISLLIYPIKTYFNPLFESIIPVVITITAVILAVYYFNGVTAKFLREGLVSGISWFFICIIVDLFLFFTGKSNADELNKLYNGHWPYIPYYSFCNNWNGLLGE